MAVRRAERLMTPIRTQRKSGGSASNTASCYSTSPVRVTYIFALSYADTLATGNTRKANEFTAHDLVTRVREADDLFNGGT